MRPFHPRFHLAFPVKNLKATREFYVEILGCGVGRESDHWIDFNFFGHQITAHKVDSVTTSSGSNSVDGDAVNIPHFGVVLEKLEWLSLVEKIEKAKIEFQIPPKTRFEGEIGEQSTFFVRDPSGNSLEFKSVEDDSELFRRYD